MKTPLHNFVGDKVIFEGVISLPVMAGEGQHQVTLLVDFLVVNMPSLHNVILGRASLNAMRAVVSIYHLMMKFPAEGRVRYLRRNQREAWRCYSMVVRKGSVKQALTVNVLDPRAPVKDSSTGDLVTVPLEEADPSKIVPLGSSLNFEQRSQMLAFLQQHKDVFAWSHEDMLGISPDVIVHRLNVDLDHRLVKQKRRALDSERYSAIVNEVLKLLSVKFIEEVHYPDWIANVVLMKKENGKWRIYVDYSDLNKAYPKDSFPSPRID
ncbi:uncharacterized protein LOC131224953 [Magnolia sinica]|uniref:uncharacterized protein LOC131224953 n=1 Tax=Magnolia sinica TaxID=86752 RepID=UPI00265AFDCA|nr:uncharacterized protein LOC131224953 [Magnolia sinica]